MSKNKKKMQKSADQINQCTIYVDGMHCASCEIMIERKLLKQPGIESVDASLSGAKVVVNYQGNSKPNIEGLNSEFAQLGYKFSAKKFSPKDTSILKVENGEVSINTDGASKALKIAAILGSFIVAFFVVENLQFGKYASVDVSSSLSAFFILGVVAGLSSCAALIGGLLLSMTKQWNELYIDSDSQMQKAQPHIMFHAGRIISFVLFGGLLGLIGESISLGNTTLFAILTVVVSIVMLILALQMLGFEWAYRFKFTAPKSLTRFVADESNFKGKFMPFGIGALTFVLPCGFTLVAQTVALASGSFMQGALIMLLFALGTFPTLLVISSSGLAFNRKPHLTAYFNTVAGFMILFFALYNINGQMNVLGFPSLSDISFDREQKVEEVAETGADGRQILQVTARGFEYLPTSSMAVKSGVPTTLVVDNQGIQGCAAFIAANGLIDNFVALKPGINEIDLGTPSKGVYKLTCSMGMVKPVTINVL